MQAGGDESARDAGRAASGRDRGGLTTRLDRYQRRHNRAGLPLAVIYKYADDYGGYLAATLTYYAFVSLFPLLLLLSTVLGFVLAGDTAAQHHVLRSALSQFPVIGTQLQDPKRLGGGAGGLIIGIVGALYGSTGVAQALQYTMSTAWAVPRNSRPNPIKSRLRSLLLVAMAGVALIGTTALSAIGTSGLGSFGGVVRVLLMLASVLVNVGVFLLVFRVATPRRLTIRQNAPGAVTLAISWQLLQSFGVTYVSHVVRHASATNAVFALVLGLLAFLYLAAAAAVISIELNVVLTNRLYPRALLTPFTDNVSLTEGDRRTYRGQARAQRAKGFEEVDVTFHQDGR